MKKQFAITLAMLIAISAGLSCVFAAEYTKFSSKFVKNFEDCDAYTETETSQFEGKTFTTERSIVGWRNGFCKYQEVIKSADSSYKLDCTFTSIQLDDLYNAMKNRSKETVREELELFAEQTDPKTGKVKYVTRGTTTIKGNRAYVTWAKYQNNPYFCKPQKL